MEPILFKNLKRVFAWLEKVLKKVKPVTQEKSQSNSSQEHPEDNALSCGLPREAITNIVVRLAIAGTFDREAVLCEIISEIRASNFSLAVEEYLFYTLTEFSLNGAKNPEFVRQHNVRASEYIDKIQESAILLRRYCTAKSIEKSISAQQKVEITPEDAIRIIFK